MNGPVVPARLQVLAAELEKEIESLPGVTRAPMWGSLNLKVGKNLFVCHDARAAILAGYANPHGFKSHAATGWVKVTVSREVDAAGLLWMLRRRRERLG